ncbi:MAG TPA: type II/IV secretion system ATPase subunit [Candidatus Nanoarchaeia archaeon]|nr:type II/IV secretion system ATPase subunit [Candidatus Nanoarchaeia archaeon]
MPLFGEKVFSYEVTREGEDVIVNVNCEQYTKVPSLEDDPITMAKAMDYLNEVKDATKIVFYQKRNYEYDYTQTRTLSEFAMLQNQLVKRKDVLGFGALVGEARFLLSAFTKIQHLISSTMKSDPVGAYVEIARIVRDERIRLQKAAEPAEINALNNFISKLDYIKSLMERTRLIQTVMPDIPGFRLGSREIYRKIFSPNIRPDFMFTKLMSSYPLSGEEVDSYSVNNADVAIFELPDTVQYLYHITPPEFKLPEEKYEILDTARKILAEHEPKRDEFVEPERMRAVFFNVGYDLVEELAGYRNLKLKPKEIEELANILVRYTVGFGLIEVLLQDEKIQDITINSPMGNIPMFIVHQDFADCKTNIIPTKQEAESWASKMRMISGRPLDEANPILDTELQLPGANTRVAVVSNPLNPSGLAYAFRRHRDKPWTFPLFIKNKMMNPIAAGTLSFLIDGARTMLVAGTRSAGKTSLLSSVLVEVMRKYRVITIEDTLELPGPALRNMGYNIQQLKVAAAMTKGTAEVPAEEGIRTTLRMGDSCLIVGEVRSTEAKSLYEAMRIGALANIVAGTIHADSPYGVFDRVVNDLGVPRTSFKATDVVMVANPIRSADGLHRWRRVTSITEIRKHWEQDPLLENGFVDLLKYDTRTDQLEPSTDLINGDSEILKGIAGNVKEWAGNWDAVWDNILLRAKTKEEIVNISDKINNPQILEAEFTINSNDQFHKISDKVKEEVGSLDSKRIFFEWNEWLKREVKKKG